MTEKVQPEQEVEQPQQEVPSITLNDLGAMVQIIDVCSKRGAFEGAELESVGVLRSRLVRFIKSQQPAEEAEGVPPAAEAPAA